MKIFSNINIDENKWKEYLYVFFKDNEDEVNINVEKDNENIYVKTKNKNSEVNFTYRKIIENQVEIMAKVSLLKLYNIKVPWGALVGVRPTKLVRNLSKKFNYDEIKIILKDLYLLEDKKINLLVDTAKNSNNYLENETIALYIGHAFCPTICTYCSFPAYMKKGKYEKRYDEYIKTLYKELEIIAKVIKEKKLKISSIYIGGGTPSYMEIDELENILKIINKEYDLSYLKEFTFEAGRIDTITLEKLTLLKKYNVDRISINPQSFKEETLKLVNRYHNKKLLDDVYTMAKKLKFIINMDFIIGLPKETTNDILNTINILKNEYRPENITFHYLALKKASNLVKNKYEATLEVDFKYINEKIIETMREMNYHPYYLYRQKSSTEFGENIGFTLENYQNIYNIEMIEENKTVISIGAGSITKIIKEDEIIRIVNPKDPLMWINEFDERIEEKLKKIRGI